MQNNQHFFSKRKQHLHPYSQELLLLHEESANLKPIHLKELRIGNLLSLKGSLIELTTLCLSPFPKIGFKVIGLTLEKMLFNVDTLKGLAPLSLNNQVLSYCKAAPEIRYEKKSTNLYSTYTTYLPQIKVYYKEAFIAELSYLHQFQNLHFSLTTQELKINLENSYMV